MIHISIYLHQLIYLVILTTEITYKYTIGYKMYPYNYQSYLRYISSLFPFILVTVEYIIIHQTLMHTPAIPSDPGVLGILEVSHYNNPSKFDAHPRYFQWWQSVRYSRSVQGIRRRIPKETRSYLSARHQTLSTHQ